MKCIFCAEEIQDEARLCRHCGARHVDGAWQQPAAPGSQKRKNSFTIVTSGWLLLFSGLVMLFGCTSPVPLFGAVRTGSIAIVYNVVLGAGFAAMGYALAYRKPWALAATTAASALYTLDKLLFIFDAPARRASLSGAGRLLALYGPDMQPLLERLLVLASWSLLAGWWCLAVYVYFKRKRGYFRQARSEQA